MRSASHDAPVRVLVDERDERGGEKVWQWMSKGVPLRLEIGPRDIEKDAVFAGRRDRAPKDKQSVARAEFVAHDRRRRCSRFRTACSRAPKAFRTEHTREIDSRDEFYSFFASPSVPEGTPTPIHAGFALTHFSGDVELEAEDQGRPVA